MYEIEQKIEIIRKSLATDLDDLEFATANAAIDLLKIFMTDVHRIANHVTTTTL